MLIFAEIILHIEMSRIPVLPILGVPSLILLPQQITLQSRKHKDQEARSARNPHALAIIWRLFRREDLCSQNRATLAPSGEDGEPCCTFRVGGVCVRDPGEDKSYGCEDNSREKDAKISYSYMILGRQQDITNRRNKCSTRNKRTPHSHPIRNESTCHDTDKAQHIWWSRKPIRLNRTESSHLGNDCGYKKRQRGKTDIAAEIHKRREIATPV